MSLPGSNSNELQQWFFEEQTIPLSHDQSHKDEELLSLFTAEFPTVELKPIFQLDKVTRKIKSERPIKLNDFNLEHFVRCSLQVFKNFVLNKWERMCQENLNLA